MIGVDLLLRLDGRVALVTGASGGIGAAIARRLAEAGAAVVVHYRSGREPAEAVAREIVEDEGEAVALGADLTDADAVDDLFERVTASLGRPGVVVNNAGIYPVAELLDMTPEEWDETLAANLRSTHLVTRAAAAGMQGAGGSIVNIASIEGHRPARGHAHYSAAKAAVLMHTRAAAQELGEHGIRVNAVSPGLIGRVGIEEAWPEGVERWRAACPLERLGEPLDVADAVLFFASDASRWISGAELVVDGGTLTGGAF